MTSTMMRQLQAVMLCLCAASMHAREECLSDAMGMVQTSLAEVLPEKPLQLEENVSAQIKGAGERLRKQQKLLQAEEDEAARKASVKAKVDADFQASRKRAELRIAESKAKTRAANEAAGILNKQRLEAKRREQERAALKRRWRLRQVREGNVTNLSESEWNMLQRAAKWNREQIARKKKQEHEAAKAERLRHWQHQQAFKEREAEMHESAKPEREHKSEAAHAKTTEKAPAQATPRQAASTVAAPPQAAPAFNREAETENNQQIHLNFVNNVGQGTTLAVPVNALMHVPMKVASHRLGLDMAKVAFSYNGKRIQPRDRVDALADGDTINVDGIPEE